MTVNVLGHANHNNLYGKYSTLSNRQVLNELIWVCTKKNFIYKNKSGGQILPKGHSFAYPFSREKNCNKQVEILGCKDAFIPDRMHQQGQSFPWGTSLHWDRSTETRDSSLMYNV
jgi:hypothetical protein